MTRDPIAALIQLAGLKVDQARLEHARAQAEIVNSRRSMETLRGQIVHEQDHTLSQTDWAFILGQQGIAALYQNLAMENKILANLEEKASQTLQHLREAILAQEQFAIHQSRVRQHHEQVRQRRETAGLEDLYLGRHSIAMRPER